MSKLTKLTAALIVSGVDTNKVMEAFSAVAVESAQERAKVLENRALVSVSEKLPAISNAMRSAGVNLALICAEAEKLATTPQEKLEVAEYRAMSAKAISLFTEIETKSAPFRANKAIKDAKAAAEKLSAEVAKDAKIKMLEQRNAELEEAATAPQA